MLLHPGRGSDREEGARRIVEPAAAARLIFDPQISPSTWRVEVEPIAPLDVRAVPQPVLDSPIERPRLGAAVFVVVLRPKP